MAMRVRGRHSLRNTAELVWALTTRDLRLRYQDSIFGWAWSLVRPLALGIILTFALGKVLRTGITAEFLLAGLFPWFWFQSSVQAATGSFIGNAGLLKKVRFPRVVLPLSIVLANSLQFVLTLPVLFGFLVYSGHEPGAAWGALPLIFALQLVLTLGAALFVASVTVFLRDLEHITEVVLGLLFYATPIIYAADLVPDGYRWVTQVNPLAPLIEGWRDILLDGELPGGDIWISVAMAVGLVVLGWMTFRRLEESFADVV